MARECVAVVEVVVVVHECVHDHVVDEDAAQGM